MMRGIVGTSLKYPRIVLAIAAALMVAGVWQLREMPVDALPEFTPPTVEVQTEALGLSATEVEQLVTTPIEQDFLNGVAFLDTIRSQTLPGLSRIELVFEPGTDIYKARQVVQERLSQTHVLPNVTKPPTMLQPLSSTARVMMIGLSSQTLSLMDLSVLSRWTVQPRLLGVPGVANVAVFGQREQQVQVQVDPERLRQNGVTLDEVIRSAGNALVVSPLTFLEASTPGTGGFIDQPNQRLSIQHLQSVLKPEDLAQVVVERTPLAAAEGEPQPPPPPPVRLGQVADLVTDHQPLIGDGVLPGAAGLVLVVERFPDADVLDVTNGVNAALDSLRPGLNGVDVDPTLFRPAAYIESSTSNATRGLVAAAVLLFAGLALLLLGWRGALVSLVAIPLSLVAAAAVLHLRGVGMNGLVLAGLLLAVGVVTDESLIDRERVAQRIRQHRQAEADVAPGVLDATVEGRSRLAHATVAILVAMLPVLFLGGLAADAFLPPVAYAYALAVVAAFVVALTVTPALRLLLAPREPNRLDEAPLARWLRPGYERGLAQVVGTPRSAMLVAGALLIVGLVTLPRLEQTLLPRFKDTNLLVRWSAAPGTSLPEMNRVISLASREIRSLPGVEKVGGHVGRAVTSDQVVNVNSGEIWVSLDPKADYAATRAAVEEVVDGYPGLEREVVTYPEARVDDLLRRSDDAVTVRIFGIDQSVMRSKADEVRDAISEIDGVVDERIEGQAEEAGLEVEVDLLAAQRHGVVPGDVRRATSALLSGIQVGSIFEQQKVFEVLVIATPQARSSLTSIQGLLVNKPGGHVPLRDLAKVQILPTPTVIRHDAASRSVDVTAAVSGRDIDAVIADVEQAVASVRMPLEYHVELRRGFVDEQGTQRRVQAIALGAALVILLLLQASFGSWRLALLLWLALPLSLVGGLVAASARGAFTIGSFVGLFAVLGIALRNGILLFRRLQALEREADEPFGPGLVLRGARERMAPTLATASATALVMLPFAVLGDVAGLEIVHPMAVVVLGGLVTSTLLTLFVLPALYLSYARSQREVELPPEEPDRRERDVPRPSPEPQPVEL